MGGFPPLPVYRGYLSWSDQEWLWFSAYILLRCFPPLSSSSSSGLGSGKGRLLVVGFFAVVVFSFSVFGVCFWGGVGVGVGGAEVEENLGWDMGERSVSVLDCFFLILTSFWVRLGKRAYVP